MLIVAFLTLSCTALTWTSGHCWWFIWIGDELGVKGSVVFPSPFLPLNKFVSSLQSAPNHSTTPSCLIIPHQTCLDLVWLVLFMHQTHVYQCCGVDGIDAWVFCTREIDFFWSVGKASQLLLSSAFPPCTQTTLRWAWVYTYNQTWQQTPTQRCNPSIYCIEENRQVSNYLCSASIIIAVVLPEIPRWNNCTELTLPNEVIVWDIEPQGLYLLRVRINSSMVCWIFQARVLFSYKTQ